MYGQTVRGKTSLLVQVRAIREAKCGEWERPLPFQQQNSTAPPPGTATRVSYPHRTSVADRCTVRLTCLPPLNRHSQQQGRVLFVRSSSCNSRFLSHQLGYPSCRRGLRVCDFWSFRFPSRFRKRSAESSAGNKASPLTTRHPDCQWAKSHMELSRVAPVTRG